MTVEYHADFSAGTVGALPAGWTRGIGTKYGNAESWAVQSVTGATGGKALQVTGAAAYKFISPDALDGQQDVDMTIRFRQNGASGSGGIFLGAKTNAGTGFPDGLMVRPGGAGNVGVVLIVNNAVVSNVTTSSATVPSIPAWTANTWLRLRVQKINQTARVKVWLDGDAEPASWQYTLTHSGLAFSTTAADCRHGLITFQAYSHDFDIVETTALPVNTDFSIYPSAAGAPTGWSYYNERGTAFDVAQVITDGTAGVTGGKVVKHENTSGNSGATAWLYLRKRTEEPLEALTKVRSSRVNLTSELCGLILDAPTAAGDAGLAGYYFMFGGTNKLYLKKGSGGGTAGTTLATATVATHVADTWYWIRAKREGNTLYGRIWMDGDAEPSTWQITYTDSSSPLVAGNVGLGSLYGGNAIFKWDSLVQVPPPTATNYSVTLAAPSANTAEALAPTLNLQAGISIDVPIADASAGAFDPDVTAIVRQDVSVDLSAVPVPGALATAVNPEFGYGPSIPVDVATASGSAPAPTIAPLDRAFTDFSTESLNAVPAGWSGDWDIRTQTSDGDGGRSLRYVINDAFSPLGLKYRDWDLLGDRSEGAVTARVRINKLPPVDNSNFSVGVRLGSGALGLSRSDGGSGKVSMYVAGSNLGHLVGPILSYSVDTWVWLKLQLIGGVWSCKAWLDGDPEPAWMGSYTPPAAWVHTDQGPGVVMWSRAITTGTTVEVDNFEFDTSTTSQVPDSKVALRSQVLPLVQKNLGLRWKATQEVAKTVQAVWGFGSDVPVVQTVALAWTGVQQVQTSTALRWETLKEPIASTALRWVTRAEVSTVSREARWGVRTVVGTTTADLRWGQVRTVDAPTKVEIPWQDQAPVVVRLATRWATQNEGRVVRSLAARWHSLVSVTKTLRERWSANLDALGVLVEDFDDETTGTLTPASTDLKVIDNNATREIRPDVNPGNPNYSAWTIVEDPLLFGGKALQGRGQAGAQSNALLYFVDEPDPWEHDVVARIRRADPTPGVAMWQMSVRQLLEYDVAGKRSYNLSSVGNVWTLNHVGPTGSIVQSSSAILSLPDDGWIWTRIQVRRDVTNQLTQAKAKIWLDGTPEPLNWTLDFTVNGMAGFPHQGSVPIETGYSGQYTMLSGHLDVDRVSWTTPSTHVVVDGPATALFGSQAPSVSLRQTILAPTGRAGISFPEPAVDIGDQVLVSWLVLEIPAAISVIEAVEVDDLGSAELEMPVPSVAAQASRSVEAPVPLPTTVQMPAPTVTGHSGISVGLDAGSPALISAPDPIVRVVARATAFVDPALATAEALPPTIDTELNARVDAPISSATARALKPDSINGSREVEVDLRSNAGFSMIPVQGVIATLSIQVDNTTLAQAQALPADARTGLAVASSLATASSSAFVPTVRTSVQIVPPPAAATFRARDTPITRTTTRFSVGETALVVIDAPDPVVQVFFQREDAIITGAAAYGLFKAVAPEFLSTPAEVGDALVLVLGSTIGEVRLAGGRADLLLGSTLGEVSLVDVRDEEKV